MPSPLRAWLSFRNSSSACAQPLDAVVVLLGARDELRPGCCIALAREEVEIRPDRELDQVAGGWTTPRQDPGGLHARRQLHARRRGAWRLRGWDLSHGLGPGDAGDREVSRREDALREAGLLKILAMHPVAHL